MVLPIATSNIVSQAFRFMEMSPISSFADDSEQATAALEQFPEAINQCMEMCDWSFASKFVDLPEAGSLPVDADLPFNFIRPGDLLRLIEVKPNSVQFRLDMDALRADQAAPLTIRYIAKITDESKLPALFKAAVSYRLAALLAPRWTTSANRTKYLSDEADAALKKAMRVDARSASTMRYDGMARQSSWTAGALV